MEKKIYKGLQDIRTVSGRVDDRSTPHRAYMKLSVLEMEKFRRGKEQRNALEKARSIDERFKQIDAEKEEILATMEGGGRRRYMMDESVKPSAPPRAGAGSFKIKY